MKTAFYLLLAFWSTGLLAQSTFQKAYDSFNQDIAGAGRQTPDGGYILCGSNMFAPVDGTGDERGGSFSMYILKLDSHGDTVWIKSYGGMPIGRAYDVQPTSDGGYAFTGYAGFPPYQVYVVKTNSVGDTLWTRAFNGGVGEKIIETSDGGLALLGGTTYQSAGSSDLFVARMDANGDTLWTRNYGSFNTDFAPFMEETSDGGFIITAGSPGNSLTLGSTDLWAIKIAANGIMEWSTLLGGNSDEEGWGGTQTWDGGYLCTGHAASFGLGLKDLYLVKLDSAGAVEWTKIYGDAGEDFGTNVLQVDDSSYLVGGQTTSFGSSNYDLWLIKVDLNGDIIWSRTYGGPGLDQMENMEQACDGGYILYAATSSFTGTFDSYLVKTDENGVSGCHDTLVSPIDSLVTSTLTSFTPFSVGGNEVAPFPVIFGTPPMNMVSECYNCDSATADFISIDSAFTFDFENISDNTCEWQWDFGDGSAINTDESPQHTYATYGDYEVCLTAMSDCDTAVFCDSVHIDDPTSIKTFGNNIQANIFPNPSSGMVQIQVKGGEESTYLLSLLDAAGRQITQEIIQKGLSVMDLSQYERGLYFIQLSNSKQSLTKRLILYSP